MNTKNNFKLILVFLVTFQSLLASKLNIEIVGLKNKNGKLLIELFNSKDTFLEKPYKDVKIDINATVMKYTFKDIPTGYYALFLVHDENNNNQAEISMFSSQDGYGISHNKKIFFIMPNFEDIKFFLTNNKYIKIKINY